MLREAQSEPESVELARSARSLVRSSLAPTPGAQTDYAGAAPVGGWLPMPGLRYVSAEILADRSETVLVW